MKAAATRNGTMRAGIYGRVSTPDQKENTSFDVQIESCTKYAQQQGYAIVHEAVICEDISGRVLNRPGMTRLLEIAEQGAIDAVILAKVDRFARDRMVDALLEHQLNSYGVKVMYVGRDTSTTEGRLLINIEKDFSIWERERIVERTTTGKFKRAREGRVIGSGFAPYGYRYNKGEYVIVPEQSQWVERMFEWVALERCSLNEVARRLNAAGVPTPRDGAAWTRSTLRPLLRNLTYAGVYTWNRTESVEAATKRTDTHQTKTSARIRDESEWIQSPCAAIVSRELYEAAQRQLTLNAERSPRNCHNFYLLRGMLTCQVCGYKLMGKVINSGGGKYSTRYYACAGRVSRAHLDSRPACPTRNHKADQLEERAWSKVQEKLTSTSLIADLLSKHEAEAEAEQRRDETELQAVLSVLAKTRQEEARLLDAYKEGVIELPQLKEHMTGSKKKLEGLEAEKARVLARIGQRGQSAANIERLEELVELARAGLHHFDSNQRRAFLEALDFRAKVDADSNLDITGWITEALFPLLTGDDAQDDASTLDLRLKRTRASPTRRSWR